MRNQESFCLEKPTMAQHPPFPYISGEANHDPAEEVTAVTPVTDGGAAIDSTAIDVLVLCGVCLVAVFLGWRLAKLVVPRCKGPIQPQHQPDSTDDAPPYWRL